MLSVDVALGVRVCCAVLLMWAGFHKAVHLTETREAIFGYRLIPFRALGAAAVLLAAAELGAGALLISGFVPIAAAAAAIAIFAVFAIGILSTVVRGIETACNCFSTSSTERTSWVTLIRALVLVAMSAWLLLIPTQQVSEMSFDRILADVTVGTGLAVLLRVWGLFPEAFSYFAERPVVSPAVGNRVSLRSLPVQPLPLITSDAVIERRG